MNARTHTNHVVKVVSVIALIVSRNWFKSFNSLSFTAQVTSKENKLHKTYSQILLHPWLLVWFNILLSNTYLFSSLS